MIRQSEMENMDALRYFSVMKTTFDIPNTLLDEGMRVSEARTKREAVLRALEEFNRRARLRELADQLGNSDTFMSHEELMALRQKEIPRFLKDE